MNRALDKRTITAVAQATKDLKAKDRRADHAREMRDARVSRALSDYDATMKEIWTEPETQEDAPVSQATSEPAPSSNDAATA
jgi:hypothetical protein